jgi:hypothetical protein
MTELVLFAGAARVEPIRAVNKPARDSGFVGLRLYAARRRESERLRAQVDAITAQADEEPATATSATLAEDRRRLRGLPAIGRTTSGVVTDSFVPGTDEHVDTLEQL